MLVPEDTHREDLRLVVMRTGEGDMLVPEGTHRKDLCLVVMRISRVGV